MICGGVIYKLKEQVDMKTKADVMTEIVLYVRLNYQDDWYLQEKINQLKERIYEYN
jgi:hypothetical protein